MVNANFLTPPQTQLVEVWHSLASVLSIDDLAALLGKPRAGVKRVIDNLNAKGITQTSAQQGQLSGQLHLNSEDFKQIGFAPGSFEAFAF